MLLRRLGNLIQTVKSARVNNCEASVLCSSCDITTGRNRFELPSLLPSETKECDHQRKPMSDDFFTNSRNALTYMTHWSGVLTIILVCYYACLIINSIVSSNIIAVFMLTRVIKHFLEYYCSSLYI